MPEVKQDCNIWQGEARTLAFQCSGAAAASDAWWFLARTRRALPADRLLNKTTMDGSVGISGSGESDLYVTVTLTEGDTSGLPPGRLHHELWCHDDAGAARLLSEGTLHLIDSLAA